MVEVLKYQTKHWGDEHTYKVCDHLLEVAKIALAYEFDIIDDYGLGDLWKCSICNCECEMEELVYQIRNGKINIDGV